MSWKEDEIFDELESEGAMATIIGSLIYTINCSSNYFIYRYLKWKENKLSIIRKSKCHVEMPMRYSNATSQINS